MLEPAVGLAAAEPGRNDKIDRIEEIVEALVRAGVTIPWDTAATVFQRTTVPRFAAITSEALPGHEALTPDCFGALVSLTFNRGPSFDRPHDPAKDPKDRYREMRGIKQAIADGEIERIPSLIRAMKRIWTGTAVAGEMNRRRENEARLFEDGIARIAVAAADARAAATVAETAGPVTRGGGATIAGIEESDIDAEAMEEAELLQRDRGIDFTREVTRSAARVSWASDDKAPDYAHLNNKLEPGIRFKLTADDLQFLADLNSFPVADAGSTPVLFGLRGCGIIEDNDGEFSEEVLLRDQRPDHNTTRCVMGVWDRAAKKIAVFEGSTVPDKVYVAKWYEAQKIGNMLPTGLYGYIVGIHNGRPGCFVLRSSPDVKRQVIVRRSRNNMIYERADIVNKSRPGDNLHPTFSSGPADFGSAGCQVVRGNANAEGNHRGPWAKFRNLSGLKTATGKSGTPYTYMLLTGLEAMLAARARTDSATSIPEVRQSLMRLRFGSKDQKVARLQTFLGVPATGEFDVATAEKVYQLQQHRWDNVSDGIFTPALDAELKAGVFNDAPAEIAVAAPQPPSTPQPTPAAAPPPGAQPAPAPAPVPAAVAAAPILAPLPQPQPDPAFAAAPVVQPQPVPAATAAVVASTPSAEPAAQTKPEPVQAPAPAGEPPPAPAATAAIVASAPSVAQAPPTKPEPVQATAPAGEPPPVPAATAAVVASAPSTAQAPPTKPEQVQAPAPVREPPPAPAAGSVVVAAANNAPADIQIQPVDGHLSSAQAAALTVLVKQMAATKAAETTRGS